MPGTSISIKYPLALDESGGLCDIETVSERGAFGCLNCQDPMVALLGSKRSHHFSHRPNGVCSSESFLHKAAKRCVVEGFAAAKARGAEYKAGFRCASCGRHDYLDLTPYGVACLAEYRLPNSEFRSDVAFLDDVGHVMLAVEVVVSNPPNPEKLAYYQRSGINVLIVRPEMHSVTWLRRNIYVTEAPLPRHLCEYDDRRIREETSRLFWFWWHRDREEAQLIAEVDGFRRRRELMRRQSA